MKPLSKLTDHAYHEILKHYGYSVSEAPAMEDLLFRHGDPHIIAATLPLLWPEFRLIDGLIYLHESIKGPTNIERERIDSDIPKTSSKWQMDQLSANTVALPGTVFESKVSAAVNNLLIEVMSQTWKAKLLSEYPERKHRVVVHHVFDNGGVRRIGFYQMV